MPKDTAQSNPLLVDTRDLSLRYADRWAVSGVNIRLAAGQSLLIAGPNGAGKSTVLRLIAALEKPTHGEVLVSGHSASESPSAVREQVSLLAQQTGLYLDMSPIDYLRTLARISGASCDRARLMGFLETVGLDKRADDQIRTFSAGMKKRVAFARMLSSSCPVVLLDEPYGQLDADGFGFVDGLLKRIVSEGRALIVVTHLVKRVAPLLQFGVFLDNGEPVWVGRTEQMPERFSEGVS